MPRALISEATRPAPTKGRAADRRRLRRDAAAPGKFGNVRGIAPCDRHRRRLDVAVGLDAAATLHDCSAAARVVCRRRRLPGSHIPLSTSERAPSAIVPARSRRPLFRTLRSGPVCGAMSGVPSRKRNDRPPRVGHVGGAGFALAPRRLKRPIHRLRIDASPKWCGSVVLGSCSVVLLGLPSPTHQQWWSNHREWLDASDGRELWRRSHTLGPWRRRETLQPPIAGRPPTPLVDPFGRRVTDLRVSITDRCNFRCTYCMPEEGMQWLPRDELLTYEEQARIVRVCVERYGFESVRITGGEPLVRAHITRLIGMLAPARRRHRADHQRREARGGGARPRRRRAHAGSTCRSTRCGPSAFPELTRRDDLDRGCSPASTPRSTPGSTR